MINLIKLSDCQETRWKNGKGITRQIAIDPPHSTLSEGNLHWRISSAEVNANDPFSQFLGFQRKLIVWRGDGLKLNGKSLLPDTVFTFSGEEDIDCELIKDKVVDIGVIYNPQFCQVEVEILNLETSRLKLIDHTNLFLFVAQGFGSINQMPIASGECLRIENENQVEIKTDNSLKLYLIKISKVHS